VVGGDLVSGPLHGLRVVELAAIGPVPFAGVMLSGLGAEVIRIEPPGAVPLLGIDAARDVLGRGRRSVSVDLTDPAGRDVVLRLVERSDVLLEGFGPGVAECLGLGPADCSAVNPRLVYGRMTGPGRGEASAPALNLAADHGGGAMFLVFGVMCAVHEAGASGLGQVVDAATVDGAAALTTTFWSMRGQGSWSDECGANVPDTGAPCCDVYECADGEFLAVGAIEPRLYAELVTITGYDDGGAGQYDRQTWREQKQRLAALFRTRPKEEWAWLLELTDACAAPAPSWAEAPRHPHLGARGMDAEGAGTARPSPALRFSRSRVEPPSPPPEPGQHTEAVLAECGYSVQEVADLRGAGVVGGA
jgi:alpha-methylacyl-CoA racemase